MRYSSDEQRRYAFRDWLRSELVSQEYYQRRGNRYLVSEFVKQAKQLGARVEEVSMGRYLRDENPVLPTPESCRELARALGRHPAEVLLEAGYLTPEDFFYMPSAGVPRESIARQIQSIDSYAFVPDVIRAQMKSSLERQLRILELEPSAQPVVRQSSIETQPEPSPVVELRPHTSVRNPRITEKQTDRIKSQVRSTSEPWTDR